MNLIAQNVGMEFFIKNFQITLPFHNVKSKTYWISHYEKQNGRDCFIEADHDILKAIEDYKRIYESGKRVNAPKKFMLELIRDLLKELSHNGVMNKAKTLDEKLLDLLEEDGKQSAAGLAEIVGSSPRTVQRALKRLMDAGKIEHVGSNRFGYYIIK